MRTDADDTDSTPTTAAIFAIKKRKPLTTYSQSAPTPGRCGTWYYMPSGVLYQLRRRLSSDGGDACVLRSPGRSREASTCSSPWCHGSFGRSGTPGVSGRRMLWRSTLFRLSSGRGRPGYRQAPRDWRHSSVANGPMQFCLSPSLNVFCIM